MFTSQTDLHQDAITIASLGDSVEAAIDEGLRELTDPQGRHNDLHFKTFEVLAIQGIIDSAGPGIKGSCGKYQVVLRVFGAHVQKQP